jgi:hypothetical protein
MSKYKKLRRAVRKLLDSLPVAQGSPAHDHQVPGCWDGDAKHPKGSECKQCQRYNKLRVLVD